MRVVLLELAAPALEHLANAEVLNVDRVGDLDAVELGRGKESVALEATLVDVLGEVDHVRVGEVKRDREAAKASGEAAKLILQVEVQAAVEVGKRGAMLATAFDDLLGAVIGNTISKRILGAELMERAHSQASRGEAESLSSHSPEGENSKRLGSL